MQDANRSTTYRSIWISNWCFSLWEWVLNVDAKNAPKLQLMTQDTNHQLLSTLCIRFCACVCFVSAMCTEVCVPNSFRLYSHPSPLYQCWVIKTLISTVSWTTLTPMMLPWPMTLGWWKRHTAIATQHFLCQGVDPLLTRSAKLSPFLFCLTLYHTIHSPTSTHPLLGLR